MTAALLFVAAVLGGAIAALSGFGIGSVLTPLLALSVGTKQAVVAVSIPHLVATSIRFWNLRHKVDRHLPREFRHCQRCWRFARRMAGLALQQPSPGLH